MNTKECTKCGEVKELSEFYKNKHAKDGYYWKCKACTKKYTAENKKRKSEYDKKYREKNKDKLKEQRKEYQENNKEKIAKQRRIHYLGNKEAKAEYDKKYRERNKAKYTENGKKHYQNNKEVYKKRSKAHREANKEHYKELQQKYRQENKEQIAEAQSKYVKDNREKINARLRERRRTDDNFNIMSKLRSRILKVVKRNNGEKAYSSIELVGMPIDEYREYLKSTMTEGMTWEAFMNGEIHLDHTKPCVSFDMSDPEQQKECFHYSNTQLLWAKDNLEKGDRLDWEYKEL